MSEAKSFDLNNLKVINYAEKSLVEYEKDYSLTTKNILDKLGEGSEDVKNILSVLGEETVICRLFKSSEDSEVFISVPKIYKGEDGKLALYDAQEKPSPISLLGEIKFYDFKTAHIVQTDEGLIVGEQIIIVKTPKMKVALGVSVGISPEFKQKINDAFKPENPQEIESLLPCGKGCIPSEIVNYYPRPVKPMKSFDKGQSISVLEDLGEDPRTSTPRYRVQLLDDNLNPFGSPVELWANYSLREYYHKNGSRPCTVIAKTKKGDKTIIKFGRADLAKAS